MYNKKYIVNKFIECLYQIKIYKERKYMILNHPFDPVYNSNSKILILGSFPSVASREQSFYYMHKQNRFWKILSCLFNLNFLNMNIHEKTIALNQNNIALYDVIKSCSIVGSSDSTIKNVEPIALDQIIKNSSIKYIYLNGNKAYDLFIKYFPQYVSIAIKLPSTSPANARYSFNKLLESWKVIRN